jgi:hypothetical protein
MPSFAVMPLADLLAAVLATVGDHGPAIVLPRLRQVDLVAAARTVLDLPQLPGIGVKGRALGIAVAIRPDLGARAGAPNERVVRRNAAVRRDADDLPEVSAEVLGLVALGISLAGRDEEIAVAREHEPRPEVMLARHLRLLPEDHLDVAERLAVESRTRDRGAVRSVHAGLRIRQVDRRVLIERGIEDDVEQPALTPRRTPAARPRSVRTARALLDVAQPARPLGHEHPTVGQEGERPGMLEALRDRRNVDLRFAARRDLRSVLTGAGAGLGEQHGEQSPRCHVGGPHVGDSWRFSRWRRA